MCQCAHMCTTAYMWRSTESCSLLPHCWDRVSLLLLMDGVFQVGWEWTPRQFCLCPPFALGVLGLQTWATSYIAVCELWRPNSSSQPCTASTFTPRANVPSHTLYRVPDASKLPLFTLVIHASFAWSIFLPVSTAYIFSAAFILTISILCFSFYFPPFTVLI